MFLKRPLVLTGATSGSSIPLFSRFSRPPFHNCRSSDFHISLWVHTSLLDWLCILNNKVRSTHYVTWRSWHLNERQLEHSFESGFRPTSGKMLKLRITGPFVSIIYRWPITRANNAESFHDVALPLGCNELRYWCNISHCVKSDGQF